MWVNASDLSEKSSLTVEVLDRQLRPLPGYSRDECVPLTEDGLRQSVSWSGTQVVEAHGQPIRIKVNWEGDRAEDAFLYAVYVEQVRSPS